MNARQKTLDLLLDVLGHETTGFNVQYASIRPTYGVPACDIDFGKYSNNLILGAVDPSDADLAQITSWPALIIATEECTLLNDKKFAEFSGEVVVLLDGYVRIRATDDPDRPASDVVDLSKNYEKHVNAFEDAIYRALRAGRSFFKSGNCNWVGFQSSRSQVAVVGDGFTQRTSIVLGFRVVI
jgi:hypothetical protein